MTIEWQWSESGGHWYVGVGGRKEKLCCAHPRASIAIATKGPHSNSCRFQLTLEHLSLATLWCPDARWCGVGKPCFGSFQRRANEHLGATQSQVVGVQVRAWTYNTYVTPYHRPLHRLVGWYKTDAAVGKVLNQDFPFYVRAAPSGAPHMMTPMLAKFAEVVAAWRPAKR